MIYKTGTQVGQRSYTVIIEPGEDGYLIAHCPEIPGCHSQGTTYEETLANIKEAMEACLEEWEGRPVK